MAHSIFGRWRVKHRTFNENPHDGNRNADLLESQHSRSSADEDQSMIGALGLSGLDDKQEVALDRISHSKQQTELRS